MRDSGLHFQELGLSPVYDNDHLNQVVKFLSTHSLEAFEDARVLAMASSICPECGQYIRPNERGDHVLSADGSVLIACKGFHTGAIRAAYWAMVRGHLITNRRSGE